ncbi:glycerol-3-phosphate permease-like protein [Haematococcus lacustris]
MKAHSKHSKKCPPGLELLNEHIGRRSYHWHKSLVLVLTFLCYAGFHASRKPPSIVKSVLRGEVPFDGNWQSTRETGSAPVIELELPYSLLGGWAPFNGPKGQSMLGEVDLAFLGAYAIGMFYAGHLGDRLDLRLFLSAGMMGSGIFVALFGMGFFWNIHSLAYYIVVSVFAGIFQSTGWPSVVSIVANWSGNGKRGLVMGIWNAHTSVGNILGSVIAAALLSSGWGWSYLALGLVMMGLAELIFLFLVVSPQDIGMAAPDSRPCDEEMKLPPQGETHSIRFLDAWRIPGVRSYALCLFFAKLIAYTFLYWLPYYIKTTPIEGHMLSHKEAGSLSVLFDIGGVAGGVMAGHLSDKSGASALVSMAFLLLAVPCLLLYRTMGHISFPANVSLMMLSGFCVNGPYALITTAVSADLGTHESLQGNSKALATVTAIIDGMGSLGAALGPLLTGYISQHGGFDNVFTMLYLSALTAALLILKLAARELQAMWSKTIRPNAQH